MSSSTRNSTVPAERYLAAAPRRRAASFSSVLSFSSAAHREGISAPNTAGQWPKQGHVFCHNRHNKVCQTTQILSSHVLSRSHRQPMNRDQVVQRAHANACPVLTEVAALHSRPPVFTARGPQLHSRQHPLKLHQEACASWAYLPPPALQMLLSMHASSWAIRGSRLQSA